MKNEEFVCSESNQRCGVISLVRLAVYNRWLDGTYHVITMMHQFALYWSRLLRENWKKKKNCKKICHGIVNGVNDCKFLEINMQMRSWSVTWLHYPKLLKIGH